jgi:hypothetical protein
LVTTEEGKMHSIFTSDVLMDNIFKGKVATSDNVTKSTTTVYRKVSTDIPLSELARIFTLVRFVVVNEETILTHNDLMSFFGEKA